MQSLANYNVITQDHPSQEVIHGDTTQSPLVDVVWIYIQYRLGEVVPRQSKDIIQGVATQCLIQHTIHLRHIGPHQVFFDRGGSHDLDNVCVQPSLPNSVQIRHELGTQPWGEVRTPNRKLCAAQHLHRVTFTFCCSQTIDVNGRSTRARLQVAVDQTLYDPAPNPFAFWVVVDELLYGFHAFIGPVILALQPPEGTPILSARAVR